MNTPPPPIIYLPTPMPVYLMEGIKKTNSEILQGSIIDQTFSRLDSMQDLQALSTLPLFSNNPSFASSTLRFPI